MASAGNERPQRRKATAKYPKVMNPDYSSMTKVELAGVANVKSENFSKAARARASARSENLVLYPSISFDPSFLLILEIPRGPSKNAALTEGQQENEDLRIRVSELDDEIVGPKRSVNQKEPVDQVGEKSKKEELMESYQRIDRLQEANQRLATESNEKGIKLGQAAGEWLAQDDEIRRLQTALDERNVKIEELQNALKKQTDELAEKQAETDRSNGTPGMKNVGVGGTESALDQHKDTVPNVVREELSGDDQPRRYGTIAEPGFGFLSNTAWYPKRRKYH